MKATLATLACLLTVGFLSAAEVTGNNTAVVIRKEVVKSDTGYQFLCVPVDGLDIANGTAQTIKLSTVLPATTLANNTIVTIVTDSSLAEGPKSGATSTISNGAWTVDFDLEGGQIFWLKEGGDSVDVTGGRAAAKTIASSDDPIIFCGQNRTVPAATWGSLTAGEITALKNDSSEAISLNEAATLAGSEVRTKDSILTIESGSSEYKQYFYRNGQWKTLSAGSTVTKPLADQDAKIIAPGEAFYYYKAAN